MKTITIRWTDEDSVVESQVSEVRNVNIWFDRFLVVAYINSGGQLTELYIPLVSILYMELAEDGK